MPPSQRRRRPAEDDESEEDARPPQRRHRVDSDAEPEEEASDDDTDMDAHPGQSADDQLAKKLIRYAISCEYSRTVIRRDGIKERGERKQDSATEVPSNTSRSSWKSRASI
ncbi:Non-structural maintenance of chromosome element 3 [Ilyonectria robusta]